MYQLSLIHILSIRSSRSQGNIRSEIDIDSSVRVGTSFRGDYDNPVGGLYPVNSCGRRVLQERDTFNVVRVKAGNTTPGNTCHRATEVSGTKNVI